MERSPELLAEERAVIESFLRPLTSGKILDVGCGCGAITNEMVKAGFETIGIDESLDYVTKAKLNFPDVRFRHTSIQEMQDTEAFNAAFCWYTSFGFGTREADAKGFAAVARHLTTGGKLLLEYPNIFHVVANFEPLREYNIGNVRVSRKSRIDIENPRLHQEWVFEEGSNRQTINTTLNLYTPSSIKEVLVGSGFAAAETFSRERLPITGGDIRAVTVAIK